MVEQRFISTAEASKALGVSVSTVKRWVDDGILPAHKTVGGHRKLLLADLVRLGRAGQLPNLDISRIELLGSEQLPRDLSQLFFEVRKALEAGDGPRLRQLFLGAYQSNIPLDEFFDEVVQSALDALDAASAPPAGQSHRRQRSRQICKEALYELKSVLEARACRNCPIAVGGAVSGEFDATTSLMVQLVLLDAAWEPINLGPNTPMASFADAVAEIRPRMLWITIQEPVPDESLLAEYSDLFDKAENAGVSVVLHAPGLTGTQRRKLKYTTYADRMVQIASFARMLHPVPRIPRRGRPSLPSIES